MLFGKHASRIITGLMAAAVAASILAVVYSRQLTGLMGGMSVRMEYETALFDTDEVMTVNIEMDEDTWEQMISNAISEEYYVCNVVINGQRVNNVAIRPKGNTSLSAIAMDPDTDRYSLKLEFDHFVEGQTCFGLDKLILNNNYADATNMKEAVIYDMFQYLGADASLYNYAAVSVNGEYVGVYLALEGIEDSFMLRNYGTQDGELYKPDTMEMGGGGFPGGDFDFSQMPDMGDFDMSDMPGGGGGFSFGGSAGADLNYIDDDTDSYSDLWDGAVTGISATDRRRVVTALKHISEGTDLETYLDVDNVLRYMAVHTFAVNMDSLSGSMSHNYYLYEYEGQLNIFPWDYNLSFGGMSMGGSADGTDMINDAIDTPFAGTDFFDALLENDEYREQYHEYLRQLVEEYVNGGRFDEVYNRIRSQIDSLVETDPTAFYSYEEYQDAVRILYNVIYLRAESIEGQLDGTIPSTDQGQRQDPDALIDGSSIDVEAMGQFSMGGGGFGRNTSEGSSDAGEVSGEPEMPGDGGGNAPPDMGDFDPDNMPDMDSFDPGNMPDMGDRGGRMSFSGGEPPSSLSIPGAGFDLSAVKNVAGLAGYLLLALVALFAVRLVKRR